MRQRSVWAADVFSVVAEMRQDRRNSPRFGELKAALQRSEMVLDDMDLLIASTALTHNLILVTNNEKHFQRIQGLDLENWAK